MRLLYPQFAHIDLNRTQNRDGHNMIKVYSWDQRKCEKLLTSRWTRLQFLSGFIIKIYMGQIHVLKNISAVCVNMPTWPMQWVIIEYVSHKLFPWGHRNFRHLFCLVLKYHNHWSNQSFNAYSKRIWFISYYGRKPLYLHCFKAKQWSFTQLI